MGSREQHFAVRQLIVQYITEIGDVIWSHQIVPLLRHLQSIGEVPQRLSHISSDVEGTLGIERDITSTRMYHNGTWGTAVEVTTLSHLLAIHIYCYDSVHGWTQYSPANVMGIFNYSQTNNQQKALYIHHNVNHCDVVSSVQ